MEMVWLSVLIVAACFTLPQRTSSFITAAPAAGGHLNPGKVFASTEQNTESAPISNELFQDFEQFLNEQQEKICSALENIDGKGKFVIDDWQRGDGKNGGRGSTRVLEGGAVLEKAAVSVSVVRGRLSAERAATMASRAREGVDPAGGQRYAAAALSLVLHSGHPHVPTFRSDVRYFQVEDQPGWFGGGADLTPYYLYDEDAVSFHSFYKNICSKYDDSGNLYQRLKKWCDDYFYIPIRKEHRGVGGLFFDDLQDKDVAGKSAMQFTKDVAEGWMESYFPIIKARREIKYSDEQRQWQLLRRGRYLEFNLLYDRGVKFGLNGGRVESVMVSAPPLIAWKYNVEPEAGSPEARLVETLQNPRDWAP